MQTNIDAKRMRDCAAQGGRGPLANNVVVQPLQRVAVFLGPSLEESERIAHPALTYLPPAARGDVAAASDEYDDVLLVDGVFHHALAPAPKEIYAATLRTTMFGASSMGALRGAECARYGMVPLGVIALWYACGVVDGDDEVAVMVNPRTQRALTVPMVNVRYALRLAVRRGILTASEAGDAYRRSRAIYYAERTWEEVFATVPDTARAAFTHVALTQGNLKRHDALFAIRSVLRRVDRTYATANPIA